MIATTFWEISAEGFTLWSLIILIAFLLDRHRRSK